MLTAIASSGRVATLVALCQKYKKPRPLEEGTAASLDLWNSRATMRAAMPGSWDYRRRVRKPASSHLVGFLFASGVGPLWAGTGALLSNSGHYNRSVLNPAIRVARARSRLWGYRPNRTSEPGNSISSLLGKAIPLSCVDNSRAEHVHQRSTDIDMLSESAEPFVIIVGGVGQAGVHRALMARLTVGDLPAASGPPRRPRALTWRTKALILTSVI